MLPVGNPNHVPPASTDQSPGTVVRVGDLRFKVSPIGSALRSSWDVFCLRLIAADEIRFGETERLLSLVTQSPVTQQFKALLSDSSLPAKLAIFQSGASRVDIHQQLLYVEGAVHQHFIVGGDIPLTIRDTRSPLLLVTPPPPQPSNFESEFWTKWVSFL